MWSIVIGINYEKYGEWLESRNRPVLLKYDHLTRLLNVISTIFI